MFLPPRLSPGLPSRYLQQDLDSHPPQWGSNRKNTENAVNVSDGIFLRHSLPLHKGDCVCSLAGAKQLSALHGVQAWVLRRDSAPCVTLPTPCVTPPAPCATLLAPCAPRGQPGSRHRLTERPLLADLALPVPCSSVGAALENPPAR